MDRKTGIIVSPMRITVAILMLLAGLAGLASWVSPRTAGAQQEVRTAYVDGGTGLSHRTQSSYWQYVPLAIAYLTSSATATWTATVTATETPTATATPTQTSTATPTATPWIIGNVSCNSVGTVEVCAWISNPTPARNEDVTVYGRLLENGEPRSGLAMHTIWHYKSTTSTCDATTGFDGEGSCTRDIGAATAGYDVVVDVIFTYNSQTYSTSTFFTPG